MNHKKRVKNLVVCHFFSGNFIFSSLSVYTCVCIFYIMLFPSNGLHLSEAKYASSLGLPSIRLLNSANAANSAPFEVALPHSSLNWDSVARRTWRRARSTYVNLSPKRKLCKGGRRGKVQFRGGNLKYHYVC